MGRSSLPVLSILPVAVGEVWRNRTFLARAAAAPLAAGLLLAFADHRGIGGAHGRLVTDGLAAVVLGAFAFWAHRCVLVADAAPPGGRAFPQGLVAFVGWTVVGMLVVTVTIPQAVVPAEGSGSAPPGGTQASLAVLPVLLVLYALARASMVFPLCALGRPARPALSWRLTERNGWRIVLASALPYAVVMIPALVALPAFAAEPSPSEVWRSLSTLQVACMTLATQICLLLAVSIEAAFLSLAFIELGGAEPREPR